MSQKIFNFADLALEYSFYFLLAFVPFIFTPSTSELFEFPKMILVYALTVIIVSAWAAKSILAGKLIFRRSPLDLPLLLVLLALLLSTLLSVDPHTSFWGYYGRWNGGLLSLIAYLFLYWAYVSNMGKSQTLNAIRCLIASAFLVSAYAVLEHFGHSFSCLALRGNFSVSCWVPKVQERVFATLGQPNWLAAWLVAIAPLTWWLTLKKTQNAKRFIVCRLPFAVLPAMLLAAILFTHSRSGLLGLGAAIAIFIFFLLPKKLTFRAAFLTLALLTGIFIWQRSLSDCFDLNPNTLSSTTGTESCKIRTIVWYGAVDIWRHYPVSGSGVETFAYTYYNFKPVEHNLTSEWDLLYNKAHNEYLNYLATTGIVGLTSYLLLIGVFLWWIFRRMNNESRIKEPNIHNSSFLTLTSLAAGYISLLVTNFFGFSVVLTSLLFFLFPAMSYVLTHESQVTSHKSRFTFPRLLLLLPLLLVTCYLLLKTYNIFHADQLYALGKKDNTEAAPKEAAKNLEKALKANPGEPKYYDELADSTSQIAVVLSEDGKDKDAQEFSGLTLSLSNQSLQISPRNVTLWSSRAIYLKRLAAVDQKYLTLAIQSLEKTVELAPTDPSFRYNLGVLYDRADQEDKAIETLVKTIELKPDYNQARDSLAEVYLKTGQKEKAFEQAKYVIEKIDPHDEEAKTILDKLSKTPSS